MAIITIRVNDDEGEMGAVYEHSTRDFNIACEWLGKVERMLNKQHEGN